MRAMVRSGVRVSEDGQGEREGEGSISHPAFFDNSVASAANNATNARRTLLFADILSGTLDDDGRHGRALGAELVQKARACEGGGELWFVLLNFACQGGPRLGLQLGWAEVQPSVRGSPW